MTPCERQEIRLHRVLGDRRPEPVESARWIAEIAEAIEYLDEHGVLCWDVNPGTIILSPEGRAMLTDLWKHTVTAEEALSQGLCGTLGCMPPERVSAMGGPFDCRCATYSLGIVLYELLTGIRPFSGSSPQEILQKVLTTTPRSPRAVRRSIPKELEAICHKAMAGSPKTDMRRPATWHRHCGNSCAARPIARRASGSANEQRPVTRRRRNGWRPGPPCGSFT